MFYIVVPFDVLPTHSVQQQPCENSKQSSKRNKLFGDLINSNRRIHPKKVLKNTFDTIRRYIGDKMKKKGYLYFY